MNLRSAIALIVLLVPGSARAAAREVIRTDWDGFQQAVAVRKLVDRTVRITLMDGSEFKTRLRSVSGSGLVVRATRETRKWASGNEAANIPRDQIRSVRFSGRVGHRGLIGAGVGLSAGVATAVAITNNISCDEIGCLVLLAPAIAIPVTGAVTGYFIGRATAPQLPEFILTP
jgi:small nuclear ribonucleoprotein (snRNP)-like protein